MNLRPPRLIARPARLPDHSPASLIEHHQRLVPFVLARRFPVLAADPERWEDAHAAGLHGLLHAARGFDPAQGRCFTTYATACIAGEVLSHLRRERRQACLAAVSLDDPLPGGDGATLGEMLEATGAAHPENALLARAGFEGLLARLDAAKPRELLRRVYECGESLSDVAADWGVSRQRVSLVHKEALDRLRRDGIALCEERPPAPV